MTNEAAPLALISVSGRNNFNFESLIFLSRTENCINPTDVFDMMEEMCSKLDKDLSVDVD